MDNSAVLSAYGFQRKYLSLLVEDIPEEKMCVQPGGVVNHPAWQLGHLVSVQDQLVQRLGGKSNLDADWGKRFGRGSIPSPDVRAHPKRSEFLGKLDERRGEYVRLFSNLSSDDLAKAPPPEAKLPAFFTSMGMFLLFVMISHESTHLGQLATWRRAMGMSAALSNMRG
jgi:hypothetical protein